ncbi:glycosyltransferase [Planctomycetaceae bacterium SH139]
MTSSSMPARVILTALGSRGDVNPFLAIAAELQRRGARPVVILPASYQHLADALGLESHGLISHEEFQQHLLDPDIWHPYRGPRLLLREFVVTYLSRLLERIDQWIEPGNTVLVSHPLDFASRLWRDKRSDIRQLSVHLAPLALPSQADPPRFGSGLMGMRRPAVWQQTQLWLANRLLITRWLAKPLNEVRRTIGLPPVRRPLGSWYFSPDGVLGLFPDWYGPPDLPANFQCVGFPRYDGPEAGDQPAGENRLPAAMQAKLQLSARPIVFTPGSAHLLGTKFFAAAIEACRRMGVPGLMLSADPTQVPAERPDAVRVASYVPLGQLLPDCRLLVHHGGIGTTSQALAAGLPQLICPMAFDQFDNARRIRQLGCGDELGMRGITASKLVAKLKKLLANPQTLNAQTTAVAARLEASEVVIGRAAEQILRQAKSLG